MRNFAFLFIAVLSLAGCGSDKQPENGQEGSLPPRGALTQVPTPAPTPQPPVVTIIPRPQHIVELMSARGEQDSAAPTLKILSPKANEVIEGSTVKVSLELGGELKGYKPGMDESTHTGNHIHVILDNQPYEAYYDLGQPFELRNLMDGDHTLRVFPSRPWHESYKNAGAFQLVKFTVKNGGADPNKPATANGQQVSGAEGKDMLPSNAGKVDISKPLLTYSRPKGEYKGADGDAVMIDFWLSNAKLSADGGMYQVRYSVDGGEPHYLVKWEPVWTTGWTAGKHTISLDLVDKSGTPVDNGGYNSTTREITISK